MSAWARSLYPVPTLLTGLLVALAVASPAAADPLDARQVLADEAFGFCHDERYPLTEHEAEWCPLLPEVDPPCPAFRAACKAPRAIEGEVGPQWDRTPGKSTQGEPKPKKKERGPDDFDRQAEKPREPEPTVGSMGTLAHVLMWVIVAIMVIAVVMQLRGPAGSRSERSPDAPEPDVEPEPDGQLPPEPGETDVDRLLARAVARAERGELHGAVADGHAALVRRLAERGHIRLHPSRTNGDHVRDLRGAPALHEPTRQVMRIVERVQFGHAPITRADVDRLLQQVRAVLGAVAGALLLLWTSLACQSHEVRRYPWSHSPSGTAGVLQLLRSHGLEVEYRTTTLDSPDGLAGRTPVVLDEAKLSDAEWSALVSHVRGGGRAVLATREPLPAELGVRRVDREGHVLHPFIEEGEPLRLAVPGGEGLAWAGDEGRMPLWVDAHGTAYALLLWIDDGFVLVLADDRLLTNAALAVPDDAEALAKALRDIDRRFELVDGGLRSITADGGAEDPFDAMSRAHLTPAIVQLLLLVLLLYLWRGVHFGRPRDPPPPSRRRFVEHVEALAQHYHRAGARRHALRVYAGWALERIHERFGAQRRGLHHLARRIAARTGRDETEIMRTLAEAHHARDDDHDGQGSEEDLRVVRELGRLIDTRGPP